MNQPNKSRTIASRLGAIAGRIGFFVVLAFVIGLVLNKISDGLKHSAQPAGFWRGMLQGALMPMSMPNLLVGKDVAIYSLNNTGITYKLGFTMGTNGCGALFFGISFWRVTRWRAKPQEN